MAHADAALDIGDRAADLRAQEALSPCADFPATD